MPPRKSSSSSTQPDIDPFQPKYVVQNTFIGDNPAVAEARRGGRRRRAQTDLTDGGRRRSSAWGPLEDANAFALYMQGMAAGASMVQAQTYSPNNPYLMSPAATNAAWFGLSGPGDWQGATLATLQQQMKSLYEEALGKGKGRGRGGGRPKSERKNSSMSKASTTHAVSATNSGKSDKPEKGVSKQARMAASSSGDAPAKVPLPKEERKQPETPPDGTTVMLRNIPNRYTRTLLLDLLDDQGFQKLYDFVYLPIDFRNSVNLGYAFVNLVNHEEAQRLMDVFQDWKTWKFESNKVCEVSWAHPHQGREQHVDRYKNSPVMHESIAEEWKPIIFVDGERAQFPPPTKAIKAPKVRQAIMQHNH